MIALTESFISGHLKSISLLVYKLTSKFKKDFLPCEIPLVLRSKSTILCSLKSWWFMELNTECLMSRLRLHTTLFQLLCSNLGVTHDCMFMYNDFKFFESTVPYTDLIGLYRFNFTLFPFFIKFHIVYVYLFVKIITKINSIVKNFQKN